MNDVWKVQTRCRKCVYRAEFWKPYKCNYEGVTGHTRKAQPPEQCTYFKQGAKLPDRHGGTEALRMDRAEREVTKVQKQSTTKYDWVKAHELYEQGKLDREIANAIGCAKNSVTTWRRRHKLKPNAEPGYCNKPNKPRDPMILEDVMAKLQEAAEKRGASRKLTEQALEAISVLVDQVSYLEEKLKHVAGQ